MAPMGALAYIGPCAGWPCTDTADAWAAAWLVSPFAFVFLRQLFCPEATLRERAAGLATAALLTVAATAVAFQFFYYEDPRAIVGWGNRAALVFEALAALVILGILAATTARLAELALHGMGAKLLDSESGGPVYRRLAVPARR